MDNDPEKREDRPGLPVILSAAHAIEDAQYGLSGLPGILKNLPVTISVLGKPVILRDATSVAAVAASLLVAHWDELKASRA